MKIERYTERAQGFLQAAQTIAKRGATRSSQRNTF